MKRLSARRMRQVGVSLIEIMVALVIGLVVSLAIFVVLGSSESRNRTSTSINDIEQSGAYAGYVLDRLVRSAGSGFTEGFNRIGSCRINARLPSGATLPRNSDFPAPFAGIPRTIRLAPLVVYQGAGANGGDILMIQGGNSGFGEVPVIVSPGGAGETQVSLSNTIGLNAGDLVVIAGAGECALSQVDAAKVACRGSANAAVTGDCPPALPLGGVYYSANLPNAALSSYSSIPEVQLFNLGSPVNNPPNFALFGSDASGVLFRLDLLETQGAAPVPLVEGVRRMNAVYGLDTNSDGRLDAWQLPTAGSGWDSATLLNGSQISADRLKQIVAVRLALVTRSDLIERELEPGVPVAPESIELFSDLPAGTQVQVDLTAVGENRNQRHRVMEITIPVRNHLLRTL